MSRDFGAEIDSLKEELRQLRKGSKKTPLPKIQPKTLGTGKEVLTPEGCEQLNDLRDQLMAYTEENHETGAVTYAGTFCSGDGLSGQQSIWASAVPTDYLLTLNDNRLAEKVLTSVGNSQRLAILLALLKKPLTVNQLVEVLDSNSTGQIYHHLKPLVAADIVKEEKGVYGVIPHRVQGIIMLLAGVWDLIDSRYTSGNWEEQP